MSLAAWSVRADGGGSVTVTLRELTDAAQLKQALAANGVPALLHFGGGPCSADRAPQRGPIGLARIRAAGGHLTITMTFKASLWPAGSELYITNSPLGPQMAVIPQGHSRAARRPAAGRVGGRQRRRRSGQRDACSPDRATGAALPGQRYRKVARVLSAQHPRHGIAAS